MNWSHSEAQPSGIPLGVNRIVLIQDAKCYVIYQKYNLEKAHFLPIYHDIYTNRIDTHPTPHCQTAR
jgi:hypothetical protein